MINTHKYFDDLISEDLVFILANKEEPHEKHGLKRKGAHSDVSELFQMKRKVPKTNSSLAHVGEKVLREDKNISHLQRWIELAIVMRYSNNLL